MRHALTFLLAGLFSAFAVLAQNPNPIQETPQPQPTQTGLAGTYEILDECDQPIDAPNIYRMHFAPIVGTPFFVGFVTFEGYDESGQWVGPEVIDDKELTYIVAPAEDGYDFESVGGATVGHLTPTDDGFVQESTGNQPNHLKRE